MMRPLALWTLGSGLLAAGHARSAPNAGEEASLLQLARHRRGAAQEAEENAIWLLDATSRESAANFSQLVDDLVVSDKGEPGLRMFVALLTNGTKDGHPHLRVLERYQNGEAVIRHEGNYMKIAPQLLKTSHVQIQMLLNDSGTEVARLRESPEAAHFDRMGGFDGQAMRCNTRWLRDGEAQPIRFLDAAAPEGNATALDGLVGHLLEAAAGNPDVVQVDYFLGRGRSTLRYLERYMGIDGVVKEQQKQREFLSDYLDPVNLVEKVVYGSVGAELSNIMDRMKPLSFDEVGGFACPAPPGEPPAAAAPAARSSVAPAHSPAAAKAPDGGGSPGAAEDGTDEKP